MKTGNEERSCNKTSDLPRSGKFVQYHLGIVDIGMAITRN